MFGLGPVEMVIAFVIFIILFGGKRLPEVAKALGKGIKEFKKEATGSDQLVEESKDQQNGGQNEVH